MFDEIFETLEKAVDGLFNFKPAPKFYIRIANKKTFYYEHLKKTLYRVHYCDCLNGKIIDLREHPDANLIEIDALDFYDAKKTGWLSSVEKVSAYLKKD